MRREKKRGKVHPHHRAVRAACSLEPLESRRLLTVVAPQGVAVSIGYRELPDYSTDRAHLSWIDNNFYETGYRIEQSSDGLSDWQVLDNLPPDTQSASYVLDAGQKMYYRVRAVENGALSAPSVVVTPFTSIDRAVQVSVEPSDIGIELSWPYDTDAVSYSVSRKARNESTWTLLTPTPLSKFATGFADPVLTEGAYEYRVERVTRHFYGTADGSAFGYVYAGNRAPLVASGLRGNVLLVVDQTQASALTYHLTRYRRDLMLDGWNVQQLNVPRDNGDARLAQLVKQAISDNAGAMPGGVQSIVLIGHVPVPYSGTTNWDGHTQHSGAWPADVYYGESINRPGSTSGWTDTATFINTFQPDNSNLPGDGKFDQNTVPGPVMAAVGRIDFANLSAMRATVGTTLTPIQAETAMLKRYFNKNHSWRIGAMSVKMRALEDDELGGSEAENGWRNFAPLVGADQTFARDWQILLEGETYLFASGLGGGSNTAAANVIDTNQLGVLNTQVGSVFNMMYGSWFGDWNKESNLMRSILASAGSSLAVGWVGTPNWFMHTMGLGETIGQALLVTQSNGGQGPYQPAAVGLNGVHVALMGDPTLSIYAGKPVKSLDVAPVTGGVKLTWNPPADGQPAGYLVYRAPSSNGPFTLVTRTPLPGSSAQYIDRAAVGTRGSDTYMVRALRLRSTPSGSFFDAGEGATITLPASSAPEASAAPLGGAVSKSIFSATAIASLSDASADPLDDLSALV